MSIGIVSYFKNGKFPLLVITDGDKDEKCYT
jgi:hypothetical protein